MWGTAAVSGEVKHVNRLVLLLWRQYACFPAKSMTYLTRSCRQETRRGTFAGERAFHLILILARLVPPFWNFDVITVFTVLLEAGTALSLACQTIATMCGKTELVFTVRNVSEGEKTPPKPYTCRLWCMGFNYTGRAQILVLRLLVCLLFPSHGSVDGGVKHRQPRPVKSVVM